jgi:hypothetical protein
MVLIRIILQILESVFRYVQQKQLIKAGQDAERLAASEAAKSQVDKAEHATNLSVDADDRWLQPSKRSKRPTDK